MFTLFTFIIGMIFGGLIIAVINHFRLTNERRYHKAIENDPRQQIVERLMKNAKFEHKQLEFEVEVSHYENAKISSENRQRYTQQAKDVLDEIARDYAHLKAGRPESVAVYPTSIQGYGIND